MFHSGTIFLSPFPCLFCLLDWLPFSPPFIFTPTLETLHTTLKKIQLSPQKIVFQFCAMIEFVIYRQCKLRHLKAMVASILILSAENDGLWSLSLCSICIFSQSVSIWLRWRVLFIHFPLWDPACICFCSLSDSRFMPRCWCETHSGSSHTAQMSVTTGSYLKNTWQILLESLLCDHLLLSLETVVSEEWFRV